VSIGAADPALVTDRMGTAAWSGGAGAGFDGLGAASPIRWSTTG
jgi:hypothetical protein